MNTTDVPKRDCDEMSIASDFSIIPETFSMPEEGAVGGQVMASDVESHRSDSFSSKLSTGSSDTSFGKVLFQNIQASYSVDSDIPVTYVLTPEVTAKSSDRVALYRIGFSSPQDYLSYQWAATPSKDHTNYQLPLTVVFKGNSFPKDAGEFFQFCYVTHENKIVGASTPFQLLPVGSLLGNNVCGVEEEEGMVLVCSKESIFLSQINKLTEETKNLKDDLAQAKEVLQQKEVELNDKGQQLTMCQHHLEALETKAKKATAEKCELMGRVGQVVEEKGHLEDRMKLLERHLESSHKQIEEMTIQIEQVTVEKSTCMDEVLQLRKHREKLEISLQKCQSDLSKAEDSLKCAQSELAKTRDERDNAIKNLELWTSSAASDKCEKDSLVERCSKVNEELIIKSHELERSKITVKDLEESLASAVVDMTSIKDKLKSTEEKVTKIEEEKEILEERQSVVNQDNDQLKESVQQLRNKVEQLDSAQVNEKSGREAAERIASDLSSRLQIAKAEYHRLALTNLKLVKKLKKMRRSSSPDGESSAIRTSISSQDSSWLNVEGIEGITESELGEEIDDVSGTELPNMVQSCISIGTSGTTCTNCSQTTQQLSESVHQKMEDMVRVFSLQIESLKSELIASQKKLENTSTNNETPNSEQQSINSDGRCISQKSEGNQEIEDKVEDQTQPKSLTPEINPHPEQGEQSTKENESSATVCDERGNEKQVLYSNSFLPAQRTAPVFLPERERLSPPRNIAQDCNTNDADVLRPSAPSPTPSMLSQQAPVSTSGSTAPVMIVSNCASGSNLVSPRAHPPLTSSKQPVSASILPPPLLPETTPTARQAAVMSQFTSQQPGSNLGHESEDDDFHSTSDKEETAQLSSEQSGSLFECPMCGLSFQPGALRLLEEHINSHLEYVCPVCSMAFQRNNSRKFENHVHGHFADDVPADVDPLDPSGPWEYRSTRLLEID